MVSHPHACVFIAFNPLCQIDEGCFVLLARKDTQGMGRKFRGHGQNESSICPKQHRNSSKSGSLGGVPRINLVLLKPHMRESNLSSSGGGYDARSTDTCGTGSALAASDANDFEAEHRIYHEDAVLEYPQSGERIRGRLNIQITRTIQPNKKRFTIQRLIGGGDLWITEFILSYDGKPSYTVSIMEFRGDKVARETQYFADPFEASPARAQYVERTDVQSRTAGTR